MVEGIPIVLPREKLLLIALAAFFRLDFWAPWCSPWRTIGPIVKEVAKEYGGRIEVGEMNVAENLQVSSTFGIRSLPTLILFKDGKAVKKVAGLFLRLGLRR